MSRHPKSSLAVFFIYPDLERSPLFFSPPPSRTPFFFIPRGPGIHSRRRSIIARQNPQAPPDEGIWRENLGASEDNENEGRVSWSGPGLVAATQPTSRHCSLLRRTSLGPCFPPSHRLFLLVRLSAWNLQQQHTSTAAAAAAAAPQRNRSVSCVSDVSSVATGVLSTTANTCCAHLWSATAPCTSLQLLPQPTYKSDGELARIVHQTPDAARATAKNPQASEPPSTRRRPHAGFRGSCVPALRLRALPPPERQDGRVTREGGGLGHPLGAVRNTTAAGGWRLT